MTPISNAWDFRNLDDGSFCLRHCEAIPERNAVGFMFPNRSNTSSERRERKVEVEEGNSRA